MKSPCLLSVGTCITETVSTVGSKKWGYESDQCPNCKQQVDRSAVLDERFVRHTPPRDPPAILETPRREVREPVTNQQLVENTPAPQAPPNQALFYAAPGGHGSRKRDIVRMLTIEGSLIRRILCSTWAQLERQVFTRVLCWAQANAPKVPSSTFNICSELSRAQCPRTCWRLQKRACSSSTLAGSSSTCQNW